MNQFRHALSTGTVLVIVEGRPNPKSYKRRILLLTDGPHQEPNVPFDELLHYCEHLASIMRRPDLAEYVTHEFVKLV